MSVLQQGSAIGIDLPVIERRSIDRSKSAFGIERHEQEIVYSPSQLSNELQP
jgi:hypothetical protein